MKSFNRKNSAFALFLTATTLFSVNASAEQSSLEDALTKAVIQQSQLVMKKLTLQLQQSVAAQVKNVSAIDSVWLTTENQLVVKSNNEQSQSKQVNQNTTADE